MAIVNKSYLGIDYGEKRIGLAFADELGVAVPLVAANAGLLKDRMQQIEDVIAQRKIQVLIVGYPYNMDDSIGFKAKEVDRFIEKLEKRFHLPVERVDERLTSFQVHQDLAWMDKNQKRIARSKQKRRAARATGDVDSRAAALILREFIETQ